MAKRRDDELLRELGVRFAQVRKAAGRTQEQTAESLGIQPTTISKFERGRSGLSLSVLAQAADYFRVSIGDLVDTDRVLPDAGPGQQDVLEVWAKLNREKREAILAVLKHLAE